MVEDLKNLRLESLADYGIFRLECFLNVHEVGVHVEDPSY